MTTQSMAKLHRHKNRIVSLILTTIQFSGAEHRTKIILSTEHQYKNYFVTPKQRKLWKETNSETIFHSNSSWQVSRQLLKPKISNNKFNLILDIFYANWCYPNCKHCIATVFWTIIVIVPLQKFRKKTSQRSYYERSQ